MIDIFFIETPSPGVTHGIGSYAQNLLAEFQNTELFKHHYVKISYGKEGYCKTEIKDQNIVIDIVFDSTESNNQREISIPPLTARSVLCILSQFMRKDSTTIFHLNSILQREFGVIAKEYDFKIVYTQHVSLWRILFNNDKELFDYHWSNKDAGNVSDSLIKSILIDKELCSLSDKIICLTKDHEYFILNHYGINSNKLCLIPNGLSSTTKKSQIKICKSRFGFRDDDFIFLFVGRLTDQKGLASLIQAYRKIQPTLNNTRLLIVGGGEIEKYLSLTLEISGQVSFTGYVKREDIYQFYEIADAGIVPSATEQSSFVVLEMLSHKLPIIISDIAAFDFPFQHEKNVLKVKTNKLGVVDIKDFSESIQRIYDDPFLRQRISSDGFETFNENFKAKLMATRTHIVYSSLQ